MKLKSLVLGLAVLAGSLFLGGKQVNADVVNVFEDNITVSSGGFPVPIYTDSGCKMLSGKNLSSSINDWRVVESADTGTGTVSAFDLGKNQWVKGTDVFLGGVNRVTKSNAMAFLFGYSSGKRIPVYDSPQLWHIKGYLSSDNSDWLITGYALPSMGSLPISSLDLGNNQWVSTKDVQPIRTYSFFYKGTLLYNSKGESTGSLREGDYKVFGARTINGETYVRLGNDNQWAKFSEAFNQ